MMLRSDGEAIVECMNTLFDTYDVFVFLGSVHLTYIVFYAFAFVCVWCFRYP